MKIKGNPSSEVKKILGKTTKVEVIHANDIVLL